MAADHGFIFIWDPTASNAWFVYILARFLDYHKNIHYRIHTHHLLHYYNIYIKHFTDHVPMVAVVPALQLQHLHAAVVQVIRAPNAPKSVKLIWKASHRKRLKCLKQWVSVRSTQLKIEKSMATMSEKYM